MHNDHKKNPAMTGAAVRSSMGSLIVCCGLLGATTLAVAEPGDGRRDDAHGQPRGDHAQAAPQPQRSPEARQLDPRGYEARAEEQRRVMQESGRNPDMGRRVGRLTPDERRDLRRQINEVGQDIYANPPRH